MKQEIAPTLRSSTSVAHMLDDADIITARLQHGGRAGGCAVLCCWKIAFTHPHHHLNQRICMNKYRTASQVNWCNKLFIFPVWVANTKRPKRQNQNCTTHRVIFKGSGKDRNIIYDEFFHLLELLKSNIQNPKSTAHARKIKLI